MGANPNQPRQVKLYDAVHNALCHHISGCTKEATTHILLPYNDDNVMACDEHAAYFGPNRLWDKLDDHPIGNVCGWEGVTWSFDDKRCYLADGELESLAALAASVEV